MKKLMTFFLLVASAIVLIGFTKSNDTITIGGNTWMKYNVGASASNLYGEKFTYADAKKACPEGFRIPTKDEFLSLMKYNSAWVTVNGTKGRLFSEPTAVSDTASGLYFPKMESSYFCYLWSSTEYTNAKEYCFYFNADRAEIGAFSSLSQNYVRCIKAEVKKTGNQNAATRENASKQTSKGTSGPTIGELLNAKKSEQGYAANQTTKGNTNHADTKEEKRENTTKQTSKDTGNPTIGDILNAKKKEQNYAANQTNKGSTNPADTKEENIEVKTILCNKSLVIWMKYNVGASESNIYGDTFTFEEAQTACPKGFTLPRIEDLHALSLENHTPMVKFKGVQGRWFSGEFEYSAKTAAIFFPVLPNSSYGAYWSSTKDLYPNSCNLSFDSSTGGINRSKRSNKYYVRCIKGSYEKEKEIVGNTTKTPDGNTWMNYNVGASDSNLQGTMFTYDEAMNACPDGYRLPTGKELNNSLALSLKQGYYKGVRGFWGASGIFLPESFGWNSIFKVWTFESYDGNSRYARAFLVSEYGDNTIDENRTEKYPVRCIKDDNF